MTRSALRGLALFALLAASAARAEPDGITRFVEGLPTESDECTFLLDLCDGADGALGRAERTPGAADALAARQAAIADAKVRDARDAARAIERKRGHRLACFDHRACRGIVPRARKRE
jgi:hypothetical protein